MLYKDRDFITRTLKIIDQYKQYVMPMVSESEQFEVTLLINCCLGLLVLPKERYFDKIPEKPIKQLDDWGLEVKHIINPGKENKSNFEPKWGRVRSKDELTLKDVIRDMRHSVAHFIINAFGKEELSIKSRRRQKITHLKFSNGSEFKLEIPVECLKTLVTKLAQSVVSKD